MKNYIFYLLLLSVFITHAQGKNAKLTLLNGNVIEARITEALPYAITGIIKGKITALSADSLQGFYFEGNDYLSLKSTGMEHYEFAYKLKTLDEFELYGWREVFDATSEGTMDHEHTNIYKYIKRQKDDRTRVFEYSKEGLLQIPFVNCPKILEALLKNVSSTNNLIELLETYERDCGIEMRSK